MGVPLKKPIFKVLNDVLRFVNKNAKSFLAR